MSAITSQDQVDEPKLKLEGNISNLRQPQLSSGNQQAPVHVHRVDYKAERTEELQRGRRVTGFMNGQNNTCKRRCTKQVLIIFT